MLIKEITEQECHELLAKATVARLGCCLDDQPYVVPVAMAYEPGYIYLFSTLGKKIKWMRANPKVCVEADSITGQSDWVSVIANGEYQELDEPRYTDERAHARDRKHDEVGESSTDTVGDHQWDVAFLVMPRINNLAKALTMMVMQNDTRPSSMRADSGRREENMRGPRRRGSGTQGIVHAWPLAA